MVRRARDYAEEALRWLVTDGVAAGVSVAASVPRQGLLRLDIRIRLADGGEYRKEVDYVLA